mgnify:CR=1 FL=1
MAVVAESLSGAAAVAAVAAEAAVDGRIKTPLVGQTKSLNRNFRERLREQHRLLFLLV